MYQILNYTEVSLQFLINGRVWNWEYYDITYLDKLLLCYVTGRIYSKGMSHQML